MKPFNLEEALAGKKVVTRDGREVTEIYVYQTVNRTEEEALSAVVNGRIKLYYDGGHFLISHKEHINDLFMADDEMYVYVYDTVISSVYDSLQEAKQKCEIEGKTYKLVPVE